MTRFWAEVVVAGPDDCWLWTASTHNGYGQFAIELNGRKTVTLAHRVAVLLSGRDPEGASVQHLCGQRLCCNPAHLRVLTGATRA